MTKARWERLVVLVNGAAGGGRAGRAWDRLLAECPELSAARTIVAADAASARRALDAELGCDPAPEAVIAFGGDGTAHLVAHHLLAAGVAGRIALGLVPAGTGSDLARTLGLPRRPATSLARLLKAAPRPFDALAIEPDASPRRYAINIASAGLSGAVDERVNAIADRGRLTYLGETLRALRAYEPVDCRVLVDGEELHDGALFLVAVANGRYFGRGMRVAPRAEVDDGLADVVVVPPVPAWQLPWRLPQFLTGRHLGAHGVRFMRGRRVRLEPRGPMPPFDVDGETMPSGPATIRVVPGALRILGGGS